MCKKIFATVLMAAVIVLTSSALAATNVELMNVALILEPPVESFSEPEKVHDSIQQSINKIFKYTNYYSVMPLDETAGYVQVYREENNFAADTFLKKSDIDNICKHLGSDFVIYIRVSGNDSINSIKDVIYNKTNVIMDFRVWSNGRQEFTLTKRITKTDSSFERGLNKCLQDIEKDASKVRAAMDD